MSDLLAQLKAIDPAVLAEVVRKDQRDPAFNITEWSVRRLSDKGVINPDGLWLFGGAGTGHGGPAAWSVVLKILQRSEQETPPSDQWYWKRELLLAQSGLTEQMPGPVRAPRFYRAEETPGGAWLWMEHVQDNRPGPWALDDYRFAARQLGAWNGRYRTGTPLPDQPWLGRRIYRGWIGDHDPKNSWQFPLHQKYTSKDIRARSERLWDEREKFFHVLESLPMTFSHFDSLRRNLFIRKVSDLQDELVIIDWANVGLGPLGAELYALVGMSCGLLEWPPSQIDRLAHAAFEAYLQGLQEAGWRGESEVVRLGFVAWMAVWLGLMLPAVTSWWCSEDAHPIALQQFGQAEEELFLTYLPLLPYFLDCADEARRLIKELGF